MTSCQKIPVKFHNSLISVQCLLHPYTHQPKVHTSHCSFKFVSLLSASVFSAHPIRNASQLSTDSRTHSHQLANKNVLCVRPFFWFHLTGAPQKSRFCPPACVSLCPCVPAVCASAPSKSVLSECAECVCALVWLCVCV